MSARRQLITIIVLAASVALLAGCGGLSSSGDNTSDSTVSQPAQAHKHKVKKPKEPLPERPAGEVAVEGQINGTLTQTLVPRFGAFATSGGLAINPIVTTVDEGQALADLCAGKIDLVDASRQITKPEVRACRDNGLTVIDFQTAFQAIVVATRNERDVGADCLTVSQLRAIYEAGSSINAWTQLDPTFKPLRLTTPGPLQRSTDFALLGATVLGTPTPTLADVRSDYQPLPREGDIRHAVFNHPPGPLGLFGFTYYTQFEEQLRPLEIDGETGDRCVFPSPITIQDALYPLTRTFRLYTTDRSLARGEVQEFLRFYLARARRAAARFQFVPLPVTVRRQEFAEIANPSLAQEARPSEHQLPTAAPIATVGGVGQPQTTTPSGQPQTSAPSAQPESTTTQTSTTTP